LQDWPDPRLGQTGRRGAPASRSGQVEQVRPLSFVELQRAGERLQHHIGRPGEVAAFQALVVLDAHPGQGRNFFTPQAGHAALAA
jgi:hypothetical protein